MEFNATFTVSMFSFIVFMIIMNAIFYEPILKIIEERENFINANYNDAKNSKEQARGLIHLREEKLTQSLTEVRKIITDSVNSANERSKELTDDAKLASSQLINSAKEKLQEEENKIANAIEVDSIAQSISSKILGKDIEAYGNN